MGIIRSRHGNPKPASSTDRSENIWQRKAIGVRCSVESETWQGRKTERVGTRYDSRSASVKQPPADK